MCWANFPDRKMYECMEYFLVLLQMRFRKSDDPLRSYDQTSYSSRSEQNVCLVFLVLPSTVECKAGRNVIDDNIGRIIVPVWGKITLEVGVANKWKRMSVANTTPFQDVFAFVSRVRLFTPNRPPSPTLFGGLNLHLD